VPPILDSLRKHKKFKQLASYALAALEKIIKPPRIGWEISAGEALELGGAEEVTECLSRHGVDPAVFGTCLSALSALSLLPRGLRALSGGAALASLVAGVRAFAESLSYAGGSGEAGGALLARALGLLGGVARAEPGAFCGAGGTGLLLQVLAPPAGVPGGASPALAAVLAAAAALLERATRAAPGLSAVAAAPGAIAAVLALSLRDEEGAGAGAGAGGEQKAALGGSLKRLGSMRGGGGKGLSPGGGEGASGSPRAARAAAATLRPRSSPSACRSASGTRT